MLFSFILNRPFWNANFFSFQRKLLFREFEFFFSFESLSFYFYCFWYRRRKSFNKFYRRIPIYRKIEFTTKKILSLLGDKNDYYVGGRRRTKDWLRLKKKLYHVCWKIQKPRAFPYSLLNIHNVQATFIYVTYEVIFLLDSKNISQTFHCLFTTLELNVMNLLRQFYIHIFGGY